VSGFAEKFQCFFAGSIFLVFSEISCWSI
jgi:hypothetical protein